MEPKKIDWGMVEDGSSFEPLPIGRYPAIIKVSNHQRDAQGEDLKDADGNPVVLTTLAGDEKWSIKATILDGKHVGRWFTDSLSFGDKALKRAKIILMRAGIIEGNEVGPPPSPEELDDTCWWVEIDRHEARQNKDGTAKLRKDGKPILDVRVAFAGYELMAPAEAKEYRARYAEWQAKKAAGGGAIVASEEVATADDDEVPF